MKAVKSQTELLINEERCSPSQNYSRTGGVQPKLHFPYDDPNPDDLLLLWNTKYDVLKNVNAALIHTTISYSDQSSKDPKNIIKAPPMIHYTLY